MWIQNVSMHAAMNALHYDPGPNSVLIQVVDPDVKMPAAKYPFASTWGFKFLDIEEDEHPWSIQIPQAKAIAAILRDAAEKRSNVIVHCHAGVCRSGAIVEAAIAGLGFEDTEAFRAPNMLVKRRMMTALGVPPYN
jgi:predicted protein tyrosine phosphatase